MRSKVPVTSSRVCLLVVGAVIIAAAPGLAAFSTAWTPLGPERGRIKVLAVDPALPTTVYAGTDGGLARSVDGGVEWPTVDGIDPVLSVSAVVFDPVAKAIYAAGAGGVVESLDGGAKWTPRNEGLATFYPNVATLAIDPDGTLYAVNRGRVFRSVDGAATWTERSNGAALVTTLVIDPSNPLVLYAGAQANSPSLVKTVDGGANWVPSDEGFPSVEVTALAIDPHTPATLYLGTCANGLFKSVDGAAKWSRSDAGLGFFRCLSFILVDPATPATVYAADIGAGVFKSTDGGANWLPTGLAIVGVTSLALDSANHRLYAGTDGPRVFLSSDGGARWSSADTGLVVHDVQAVAVDPTTPATLLVGTRVGVFRSTDGGQSWRISVRGLTDVDVRALVFDRHLPFPTAYAATFDQGIFTSSFSGASWERSSEGLPTGQHWTVAVDPLTPGTLYAGALSGDVGIYKSVSGGALWTPSSAGLTSPGSRRVRAIAVDPSSPATVYLATDGDGVFKSTNGGGDWTASGAGLVSLQVNGLAIDPSTPMTVYAVTAAGVHVSIDGGATWAPSAGVPPTANVGAIVVDPLTSTVYAGTFEDGVLQSSDGGDHWSPFNADLPVLAVPVLALEPQTGAALYGGVIGRSLWGARTHCRVARDCDDGDGCTVDICEPGSPAADAVGCRNPAVVCPPADQCHEAGVCTEGRCRYAVEPEGTSCEDGEPCTNDTCRNGSCVSEVAPRPSCHQPGTRRRASRFMFIDDTFDVSDGISWRWHRGTATSLEEFGDPTVSTGYTLCVYDQSGPGGTSALVMRARILGGSSCSNRSCWFALLAGFRYLSNLREPDGITVALLRAGGDGRASIYVSGRGQLALPGRALDPPVSVQFTRNDAPDRCWQASYSSFISSNDGTRFRAHAGSP